MTKKDEMVAHNACVVGTSGSGKTALTNELTQHAFVMGATRMGMSDRADAIVRQYQSLDGKIVLVEKEPSSKGLFPIDWKMSKKGSKP